MQASKGIPTMAHSKLSSSSWRFDFQSGGIALGMLVATTATDAQVSCRPNSFTGGYDCDNGVSTRPNSFTGGYDIDDSSYRLRQELDQEHRQRMQELNRQPTPDNRGWNALGCAISGKC
jgi:hypothetical protein